MQPVAGELATFSTTMSRQTPVAKSRRLVAEVAENLFFSHYKRSAREVYNLQELIIIYKLRLKKAGWPKPPQPPPWNYSVSRPSLLGNAKRAPYWCEMCRTWSKSCSPMSPRAPWSVYTCAFTSAEVQRKDVLMTCVPFRHLARPS